MKIIGIGKETTEMFQNNLQDYIHPWQYKDSEIHIVNIDSVLSDVKTNWNQEIRFRQGFQINDDKSINIPTMFVQINGIYNTKEEYRNFLKEMNTNETIRFHNTQLISLDYYYSKDDFKELIKKLKNKNLESIHNLNSSMKTMFCNKLLDFIDTYQNDMSKEDLFALMSSIEHRFDVRILQALQNFDYCFKNPKIIVENMDDKNFSNSSKYFLIFLYTMGFDILIMSPKGSDFLPNYEINNIVLDKYLSPNEEIYEYRDKATIKKDLKEQRNLNKKYQSCINDKTIGKLICFISIFVMLTLAGLIIFLSSDNILEIQTNKISWNTVTTEMYVNVNEAVLYTYASTESEVLTTYNQNDVVEVIATSKIWAKIKYNNKYGYIHITDLRKEKYDITLNTYFIEIVLDTDTNIYEYPNKDLKPIKTLTEGTKVYVESFNNDWYCIHLKNGKTKYFILHDELIIRIEEEITEETNENINIDTEQQKGNIDNEILNNQSTSLTIFDILIIIVVVLVTICFILDVLIYFIE